jgi:hypothetical protein
LATKAARKSAPSTGKSSTFLSFDWHLWPFFSALYDRYLDP